ncbi:MAG TPA: hypothetical protein DHV83_02235 [Prevotella sp.]|nr:hypothetical protein [Prevotella sp.]
MGVKFWLNGLRLIFNGFVFCSKSFFFVFNSLFIIDSNGFQFSIVLVFSFFAEMSWKLTILRL